MSLQRRGILLTDVSAVLVVAGRNALAQVGERFAAGVLLDTSRGR